ncbi:MAG: CPBP family intramembrane metalloprotease [Clostridiales bacterium]|nr:CPBP family intramembrane metalloprotease [Clostridiales bacterium]
MIVNDIEIDGLERRKADRVTGLITICLWLGLFIGLKAALVFLFRDIMNVTGTVSEDFFRSLTDYVPLAVLTILFFVRYLDTIVEDIQRLTKKDALFIAIMTFAAISASYLSGMVFELFEIELSNQEEVSGMMAAHFIPAALMALVYGPIVEELLFRKALNQLITNNIIFVTISALLFGLIHATDLAIVDYAISGALFAVVYIVTGRNIVAAILVHFFSNLVGVAELMLGL